MEEYRAAARQRDAAWSEVALMGMALVQSLRPADARALREEFPAVEALFAAVEVYMDEGRKVDAVFAAAAEEVPAKKWDECLPAAEAEARGEGGSR